MADQFISMRNLRFLLYEVFNVESLTHYPLYQEHSREIFDMVLDTGLKISRDILFPAFREMDRQPPEFVDGRVKVHPMVRTMLTECGQGGWISAQAPYKAGGQQIPISVITSFHSILAAANYSAAIYILLTKGAAHLIESFGTQELFDQYVPNMFSGKWQGTMALTEPQAGSSLTDITTTAIPTDDGYYKIKGQKIFISLADHDGVDNVVNLLLAKIQGAPLGVKGISLFVVPNLRPEPDGSLVYNDVNVTSIFHKCGYKGAPITQLALGENENCRGWLVGEPHKGLRYMFQMMNEARIEVGLAAASIASAAYYASLDYARERPQGRKIDSKDPATPQVALIEHADIKRMLLFQRAVVEGSISLSLQCALYVDRMRVFDGEEKERCSLLLDLLTPIAKSYPSEMGNLSASAGLQILGGYGYCDEFPLEQYYRDMRIHPIHEGTTGIQGMDLLGRKVVMQNGKAVAVYLEELEKTIGQARAIAQLSPFAESLSEAVEVLKEVTVHLTGFALEGKAERFLSDATVYLEFFGIIAIAWQWLLQAIRSQTALGENPIESKAQFYQGKLYTFRYFFKYELPKIYGLAKTLKESDDVTMAIKDEFFTV